jgi:hypothetical protein
MVQSNIFSLVISQIHFDCASLHVFSPPKVLQMLDIGGSEVVS